MGVRVSVGSEFFDRMRRDGSYYVDKTELLYELVHDAANMVTLFTRPRRFGKTLTLSMIESFLDIRRDSRDVFEGLGVMAHEEFCAEWMNQYPVLFITLKDAEALTFRTAYAKLQGYSVESNRERGLGRPYILLIDDANRRALVIEAKRADGAEQMERACDVALRQIVDNEYAKGLDAYQVFSYGVAFYKKSAMVKRL